MAFDGKCRKIARFRHELMERPAAGFIGLPDDVEQRWRLIRIERNVKLVEGQ
jgi:hypothetical protein